MDNAGASGVKKQRESQGRGMGRFLWVGLRCIGGEASSHVG